MQTNDTMTAVTIVVAGNVRFVVHTFSEQVTYIISCEFHFPCSVCNKLYYVNAGNYYSLQYNLK